jgi:hypothetical protein
LVGVIAGASLLDEIEDGTFNGYAILLAVTRPLKITFMQQNVMLSETHALSFT